MLNTLSLHHKHKDKDMTNLTNRIESLTTEMLISTFKGLESDNSDGADLVNNVVMDELESRLPEVEFNALLEEVYAD